jgi:hypothetical protein
MSQSDYLNKKKIISLLEKQVEFPPIMSSSLYTLSKSHSVSNDISNTLITRNQLTIQPDISNNCSKFIVCSSTNMRPNRVLRNSAMSNVVRQYVKHKKNEGCEKFCYDSSHNLIHTNNANRLYSTYNNKRLRDLCKCPISIMPHT